MKYIAVVGKMHSGKTTFSNALVERNFRRMAFADPVKEVSGHMLADFENYFLPGNGTLRRAYTIDEMNEMKGHPAIRGLLQLVGTELGRNWHGPDTIWIDTFRQKFRIYQKHAAGLRVEWPVVVDDCRFVNEAEALRELGFYIVKLQRDEGERLESIRNAIRTGDPSLSSDAVEKQLNKMLEHPSETEVNRIRANTVVKSIDVGKLQLDALNLARLKDDEPYIHH